MEYTVKELIEKLQTLEQNRKIHILGHGLKDGSIISDIKIQDIQDYYSDWSTDKDFTLENYSMYDILIH